MKHEMTLASISMDQKTKNPVVVLKSKSDATLLPIWIGVLEASSIVFAIHNTPFERPLTHDLFRDYLQRTEMSISEVVISDLLNNTYHARIVFASESARFDLDARPSDAIAMAIRFKAPIFANEEVLTKSQEKPEEEAAEAADKSDDGKKWAEYLSGLDPEDFGKYKI